MAQTQRLRDEETEMLERKTLDFMIEKKIRIKESDVLHTLIRKHLKDITANDVLKYREEVLGKD
ncbi:hypothetical protein [Acinetobacter sp. YH16032]|uniref:hypothetical protein n=1 Tax=Acinetobacter sp. YH16032 TaxID=2601181 RepID=UPI0015D2B392|nr:hypothetical protein [Acinetobacter sp. YH16032]